jgi:hypothetical protein
MMQLLAHERTYAVMRSIGFALLILYLALSFDFSFSLSAALMYVGISFGISYAIAALKLAERFPALDRRYFASPAPMPAARTLSTKESALLHAEYLEAGARGEQIFATPSEDGFICVPLIVIGINAGTALAGGALFAFLHLGRFTYLECLGKGVIYSLACYYVLPHGVLTVVAGHFTNDLLGLLILKLIRRKLRRGQPREPG